MALAPTREVILGSIAFTVFWVLAVFPSTPFLPVGRTAGSLLGAMLMVIFQVMTPDEAYDAIDLPILGLLFGTMVISAYLEKADMFKYLGNLLSWKSKGAKDLLCRICLISAISSALFTNDTSCVVLTEFVLKVAREHNLPPHPFLLALASSANIGSSATPIGNPQNLVIAIQSGISFGKFVLGLLPAMLVGVFVNVIIIMCMYWKLLSSPQQSQFDIEAATVEAVADKNKNYHKSSSTTTSSRSGSLDSAEPNSGLDSLSIESSTTMKGDEMLYADESGRSSNASKEVIKVPDVSEKEDTYTKWKKMVKKTCIYLVTIGMLVALLMGLNMSWTAITAALVLIVLDFKDAQPSFEKVSYSLLIFFCGMFITVDGFNRTGIPSALWNSMESHAKINSASGIAVLAIVILILSNLASNVPTVLLLGGRVAASAAAISVADVKKSWLILAWVSTVAGNLSLLGSAANLIVCEQARRAPEFKYNLTFWKHLKFGLPSTLIITAIGLLLIK